MMKIIKTGIIIVSIILLMIAITAVTSGFNTQPYVISSLSQSHNVLAIQYPARIYIVNHGWHTGVIIPQHLAVHIDTAIVERFTAYQYLEIGWGDAGFYQSESITTGLALKALLLPTESVVHIAGFNQDPFTYFNKSDIHAFEIPGEGIAHLMQFLKNSLAVENGKVLTLGLGLYGDSQFYRGFGRYHLWNTCNTWTAKAAHSAGIPIHPVFKLTAESVMNALDK